MTLAFGDTVEMEKAIAMLEEVKESIINAYEMKTGLSRAKISHLMDAETWLNAKKAVEMGFADGILFFDNAAAPEAESVIFSSLAVTNSILSRLPKRPVIPTPPSEPKAPSTPIESLEKRLFLLKP